MAINKKLIHFKTKASFERDLEAGNILDTSIIFIQDAKEIWTHGTYYPCPYTKEDLDGLITDLDTVVQTIKTKVDGIEEGAQVNAVTMVAGRIGNVVLTKADVGLANAENTTDLNKPISTATQTALDTKVDKVEGKGLSTNDFTDADKALLSKVSKPLNYKGSVATYSDLPANANEGDVYNVVKTDVNYAWTGAEWDPFGSSATSVVNDLTTGGIGSALSAEQGKVLKGLIDTETTTRTSQDTALSTQISEVSSNLTTKIETESTRAIKAEDDIRASITSKDGDIPVMELDRQAPTAYVLVSEARKDIEWAFYMLNYNKPYIGKRINCIKVMIAKPGKVHIAVCNSNVWKATQSLADVVVKDLVNRTVTSTGYHEFYLDEDIIIEEGQWIGAGFYAGCCRFTYNPSMTFKSAYPSGWTSRAADSTTGMTEEEIYSNYSTGYLNIGLYRKGAGGDFEWFQIDEAASSKSSLASSYYAIGQEKIIGKKIYMLRAKIATVGTLTVNVINNYGKAGASIIKSWTLNIRQLGVQSIRLPEDIILEEGQGIGVYAEGDTCQFAYGGESYGTKYSSSGFYIYTGHDLVNAPSISQSCLNIGLIEKGDPVSPLEDRTISIQGDSISTFAGTITDGNAQYYSSTHMLVNSIDATWWGRLIKECRMRLIRNDAWSGSRVSGTTDSAMCSSARCNKLANGSISANYAFGNPEIIVVMCGTNDVSGNVAMGELFGTDYSRFKDAFGSMCSKLRSLYDDAKIVIFQLSRGNVAAYKNGSNVYQYQYWQAMKEICEIYNIHYVDPSYFGMNWYSMASCTCNQMPEFGQAVTADSPVDYLHPNAQGMERVYAGVRSYLEGLY